MCDGFDSGIESSDISDITADNASIDISGVMDSVAVMSDKGTMESFEDTSESSEDISISEIMNDAVEETSENSGDGIVEALEDTESVEETQENSALDNMAEYMAEHNYGSDDFETYSQDLEWQELNNALLEADGKEPLEYEGNENASALERMTEYMYSHEYGLEDYETYSQDPEWQELNNALLEADGKASLEYESDGNVSALDLMTEYMYSHNYGLEDYDTYSRDPEWQELNNALIEELGRESIDIDKVANSFFDNNQNIEFLNSLLESRPELIDMFKSGVFFEHGNNEFGFNQTCGETTLANTLNQLFSTNEFTENAILNVAVDKNLCEIHMPNPENNGGTSTEEFIKLYEEINHLTGDKLSVELFEYDNVLGIDEMAARIESGSVLNIAVDSSEMWSEPRDITDTSHYTDHWISVTGVDRGEDGSVSGFSIIDSGGGENYLNVDDFEKCCYGVEDNPVIDPTCIVVSLKEE